MSMVTRYGSTRMRRRLGKNALPDVPVDNMGYTKIIITGPENNWYFECSWDTKKLLVRCPDFRGCNVHKQGVRIRDSIMCPAVYHVLFQDVLNKGFH